ncbi:peptidylprolyl isomerase SurA [Pleionea sp. CnH1-48]|uniref:peptidylprolyl isomerase SurA n=1 Tax=Pleionea sp. CnH1-48 TaxID=2954494 RepID=UPI0020975074|nr:peptidylprolyl isomerase SurA [Pleionea sp. CnH1-48]MCO7224439.1 peptidylprolyl isomerase SurA [Pleionea sp. CnH1-48]
MKKIVTLLVVSVLTTITSLVQAEPQKLDEIIAMVEKDVILRSELTRKLNEITTQAQKRGQPLPPSSLLQQQILERMILDSLQLQMAKRAGVRISEQELNAAVQRIAEQNNMTLEQLRIEMAEKEGIDFELFREDLRKEIMTQRVRRGHVSRRIKISERDVDNMVQLIDAEGSEKIQYRLGHILLPIKNSTDPQSIQEARDKAENLIKDLRAGADFAQTAIAHSSGQNALQGGDFGWRSAAELPSLFVASTKALEIGGISEALRSGSGFHILKLLDKRGEQVHLVDQVKARHILLSPNAIMTEAQAEAKIKDIRQKILDGADFEELAKEHSADKGSANLGGDLGWSEPAKYVGPFKTAVQTLPLNELSEPVKTQFGFHIIEVLERRSNDQTKEKKREQARRILHSRKFDEEVEAWLQEIRDTSYVEILFEFE